jgi:hypothetical protein
VADRSSSETPQEQRSNAPLRRLDVLVGEWSIEVSNMPFLSDPAAIVRGQNRFDWLEGGHFLVQRWNVEHPDFPDGIAVVGYDDSTGNYSQHYFDSRGVSRIYKMSLGDGVWKLWRDDPDFSQRFIGTLEDSGTTIRGRWENSSDGLKWDHDFDLTYSKVG